MKTKENKNVEDFTFVRLGGGDIFAYDKNANASFNGYRHDLKDCYSTDGLRTHITKFIAAPEWIIKYSEIKENTDEVIFLKEMLEAHFKL